MATKIVLLLSLFCIIFKQTVTKEWAKDPDRIIFPDDAAFTESKSKSMAISMSAVVKSVTHKVSQMARPGRNGTIVNETSITFGNTSGSPVIHMRNFIIAPCRNGSAHDSSCREDFK